MGWGKLPKTRPKPVKLGPHHPTLVEHGGPRRQHRQNIDRGARPIPEQNHSLLSATCMPERHLAISFGQAIACPTAGMQCRTSRWDYSSPRLNRKRVGLQESRHLAEDVVKYSETLARRHPRGALLVSALEGLLPQAGLQGREQGLLLGLTWRRAGPLHNPLSKLSCSSPVFVLVVVARPSRRPPWILCFDAEWLPEGMASDDERIEQKI